MPRLTSLVFGALIGGAILLSPMALASAQGTYTPVTEEEVMALKFNHYFTPENKGQPAEFEWSFTKDGFVLKKGKAPIAADLCKKLLGEAKTADEIRGKWKLEGGKGRKLVLSEVSANGKTLMTDVRLPIYKTAPTVVRIGEPQYVFGIGL